MPASERGARAAARSGRRSIAQNRLRIPAQPPARSDTGSRPSSPRTRTLPSATTTRCTRSSSAAKPAAGGGRRSRPASRLTSSRRSVMNAAASAPISRTVITTSYSSFGDLERLHQADAAARQVGLKRDAPGARVLGDGGCEAQALEIRGRTGAAEAQPRLRRIIGAGEPDRAARCPLDQRAGGMAGPPGHRAGAVEANTRSSRSVVRRTRVVPVSVGRDGTGDRAGEQEQADERACRAVPSSRQRKNRLISFWASRRPSCGSVGWATSR
mgnify:CR=1 FL=1